MKGRFFGRWQGIATLVGLAGSAGDAAAQAWPADDAWRVLYCEKRPAFDAQGDAVTKNALLFRDIVGDTSSPAFYLYADATHVFFRMRLDASPRSNPQRFESYAWVAQIDTDLDRRSYEVAVGLDGTSTPQAVRLRSNSTPSIADGTLDLAETEIASFSADLSARSVQAQGLLASRFGGTDDYFLDWAVERAALTNLGVDAEAELSLTVGSSLDERRLDGDIACRSGDGDGKMRWSTASSDRQRIDGQAVLDSDDDGLSDAEEKKLGTDPMRADTDGDGSNDGAEVQAGTNPTQSSAAGSESDAGLQLRGGGGVAGGCQMSTLPPQQVCRLAGLVGLAMIFLRRRRQGPKGA